MGSGREWRQVIQLVVKRKDRVADDAMARLQYEFSLDTVTAHHTTTAIRAAPVKSDGIFHIWVTIPEHYAIGDKLLLTATVETALGAQEFVRHPTFQKNCPPDPECLSAPGRETAARSCIFEVFCRSLRQMWRRRKAMSRWMKS